MAFFPFMIQMQDKLCVIGGGGKVAYRKVSMMLSFGARVTVIAPKICDELQKIESKQDALLLVQRPFEDGDIEGADVVIMATNDSEVNSHIAAICKDKRILVNVVDVKKDCGFYFPAIIKQDDVVVSVSTGGSAPALASQIKKSIRSHLPDNCGDMAKTLLEKRNAVLKTELAKIQTGLVVSKLQEAFPEYEYEIVYMTTKGDKEKDSPIPSFGGKAVFVEEFEQALLDDTIDLAVHSAKDMPNPCKDGCRCFGACLCAGCTHLQKGNFLYKGFCFYHWNRESAQTVPD